MPRTANRFHKRADLSAATLEECRARWRERWGFDWSDEVAHAWFPGALTEREREARRLAGKLIDFIRSTVPFFQPGTSGTPRSELEDLLIACIGPLVVEQQPERPGDPDFYRKPTVIERLVRLAGPRFTDSPDRTNLIEMSQQWRLRLVASPSRPANLPLLKSPLPDVSDEEWTKLAAAMATGESRGVSASGVGLFEMPPERLRELELMERLRGRDAIPAEDPSEDERAKAIFGEMQPSEIAWGSILLGNFPDVTARDLHRGVTVAEVIAREAHAIRAARRRTSAAVDARIADGSPEKNE